MKEKLKPSIGGRPNHTDGHRGILSDFKYGPYSPDDKKKAALPYYNAYYAVMNLVWYAIQHTRRSN